MDEVYEKTLLYDFYGELLTDHQKRLFEAAVFEDLSLTEIAEEAGITRQGVHDQIRRTTKLLNEYEAKLHLVEKFLANEKIAREICELAQGDEKAQTEEEMSLRLKKIADLAGSMIAGFEN